MLDVKKIELQLLFRFVNTGAVLVLYLRPSGDTGPHRVALTKDREFLLQQRTKMRLLGARADQAHVATKNVEKLRNFIQAILADETPHPRHPLVAFFSPTGPFSLRIVAHGTE